MKVARFARCGWAIAAVALAVLPGCAKILGIEDGHLVATEKPDASQGGGGGASSKLEAGVIDGSQKPDGQRPAGSSGGGNANPGAGGAVSGDGAAPLPEAGTPEPMGPIGCSAGATRKCADDPDAPALGNCGEGVEVCTAGVWGACSITKKAVDACSADDDANCNGTKNDGCPCVDGAKQACGPTADVGECRRGTQTCAGTAWGTCVGAVTARPRDCTSALDFDCDGVPDNKIDAICKCAATTMQECDTHPGKDGKGPCRAGTQTCIASLDRKTTAFGPCTGAVGPGAADTCEAGNDINCNGVANEGCPCVNGATAPCGVATAIGICKPGVQTCVAAVWAGCTAVFASGRDCTKATDNDCNGTADNLDATCECTPGATRDCTTSLQGPCKPGKQTCIVSPDKKSSSWAACAGAAPGKDTCDPGNDNSCDGVPNQGCACVNGTTKACPTAAGVCIPGNQVCVNSAYAATCVGRVLGALDCTKTGDGNCDGIQDQTQAACTRCPLNTSRACTPLGARAGTPCAAGTQRCVASSTKDSVDWTTCTGPTAAGKDNCSPVDDATCDGKVGGACCGGGTDACGGACCVAPPYTTASCSASSCSYTCADPLSCSNNGRFCATWQFSSGIENWFVGAGTTLGSYTLGRSGEQLAVSIDTPGSQTLFLATLLCETASASNQGSTSAFAAASGMAAKKLYLDIALSPAFDTSTGQHVAVYPALVASGGGSVQVAGDRYIEAFPDGSSTLKGWVTDAIGVGTVGKVQLQIAFTGPYKGTLLLDNVSIH